MPDYIHEDDDADDRMVDGIVSTMSTTKERAELAELLGLTKAEFSRRYAHFVSTCGENVIPRKLLSMAAPTVRIRRLFVAIAPPIFGKMIVPGG